MTSLSFWPMAAESRTYRNKKRAHALTVKTEAYHRFSRKLNVRPRRLTRFEDITNTANRVNQLLVFVYFVAQAADQHVHHVRLGIKAIIPDVLHDHGFRHHPAGVAQEIFKQGEFARLQFNIFYALNYLVFDMLKSHVI